MAQRHASRFLLASLLALTALGGSPALPAAVESSLADARAAKISGVYFNGYLRGDPEPEEAVRIVNSDPARILDVGDFALTDRFGPPRPQRSHHAGRKGLDKDGQHDAWEDALAEESNDGDMQDAVDPQMGMIPMEPPHTVRLPHGTRIPPGGEIWVAHKGKAFMQVFGFPPAVEAVDTDDHVPNAFVAPSWLNMPANQGVVALMAPDGRVVDLVGWDHGGKPGTGKNLDMGRIPAGEWTGAPVELRESSPFGWRGQVLARDRDLTGAILPDTDTAADWDSGFSAKQLGMEPLHRVELPGQTHFVSKRLVGVRAKVTCGSAPENQYRVLAEAFDSAKERIRINVYQFTNPLLGERLLDALARKVEVRMLLEGAPVGGMPDDERVILDRLARAGAKIVFIGSRKGEKLRPRYRFDHAKYTLIDDRVAVLGTENYGKTGQPVDPSLGNRGFQLAIEQPDFVRQLAEVFETDTDPGHKDLIDINEDPADAYGLPTRDPNFVLDTSIRKGLYPERREPLKVEGKMDLELVLSPDTSLSEENALLGMIKRAKREVLVLENSIARFWGTGAKRTDDTPNLGLMAVVEAARRGVKVRVLMDGTWYNAEENDARDNDDTARFLNDLAQKEGLDLYAKVINLETANLEKIHAKAVLVDGEEVGISSINWSENSFKGNREAGVVIRHPEVTGYYRELFWRDWRASRLYRIAVRDKDAQLVSEPRVGAPAIRRVNKGEWLGVVTEVARGPTRAEGFLEVPLESGMSGYLRSNAGGELLVTAKESRGIYGRLATVQGRVLEVIEKEKVLILGLDKPEEAEFQVVIFTKLRQKMAATEGDPAQRFKGRTVRVKGTISRFRGPQIEVQDPSQIQLVE